jgi:leader peptidase (prepilin peptidase)/N-methyltransferase
MVVELLGGMLALAVFEATVRPLSSGSSGSSGPNGVPWAHAVSVFAANFALSMALVAAAFIDAEHMYLPDAVTLGGTLFGIATPALRAMSFRDALVGALVGFLVVWLPLIVGYKALRGRAGMGLGDAKLVMLAGAWFGWPGALFALFAGAIQATLGAAVLLLAHGKIDEPESVKKDREELHRAAAAGDQDAVRALEEDPLAAAPASGLMAARLPFGPFLCVAIVEWMLAGWWIQERWFS